MNRWFLPSILLLLSSISFLFINSLLPQLSLKHLFSILLGLFTFFLISRIPISKIFNTPLHIYIFACILLIVPLIIPIRIRGTARWIPVVGTFRLQPSQLAFVLIGVSLSRITSKSTVTKNKTIKSTLKLLGLVALPTALIAVEPDLGTAVFFFFCMSIFLFISGIPYKHILLLLGAGVFFSYFAWLFLLQPYQKQRVTTFLQPNEASQNETYNVRQSLIAIGAGGLTGSGIGKGSQSLLRFLPEKHTDFIFAAFSEEFGFIGSTMLVVLYLLICLFLFKETHGMHSNERQYFVIFVAVYLFFQSMINICTNTGLLPVTGMTLPFFSYGGTSFVTFGLALGIAQNCILQQKRYPLLHIV